MPSVSAADVSALRARTGVSILACKQALEEADGNQEKAIEILRKKGIANAVKKADRAQSEGAIFIAEDGQKAAVVTVKCETDFVARSDDFLKMGQELAQHVLAAGQAAAKAKLDELSAGAVQKLGENVSVAEVQELSAPALAAYVHSNRKLAVIIGSDSGTADKTKLKDVAMHAAALNPAYVKPDEVSPDTLAKEREIWKVQLAKDKKPEAIMEKILLGKEKKFREENALLTQPFVKDPSQTVLQYLGGPGITTYVRVTV